MNYKTRDYLFLKLKKNMKKLFFLILSTTLCISAFAQNKNKLEAQRVAFITQRLNLTPEEAQQFWPIFNQYTEKLQQIRAASKPEKMVEDMNDADAEKVILGEFDKDAKELDLKKEYYQKLKKTISVKKIARLYKAERDFRSLLLEKIQQNRENRKQLRQEDK